MTNKLKCTSPRYLCAGLILFALGGAPVTGLPADSAPGAQKPEAGVAAAKAEAESSPSLAEILTAMVALEANESQSRPLLARRRISLRRLRAVSRFTSGIVAQAGGQDPPPILGGGDRRAPISLGVWGRRQKATLLDEHEEQT